MKTDIAVVREALDILESVKLFVPSTALDLTPKQTSALTIRLQHAIRVLIRAHDAHAVAPNTPPWERTHNSEGGVQSLHIAAALHQLSGKRRGRRERYTFYVDAPGANLHRWSEGYIAKTVATPSSGYLFAGGLSNPIRDPATSFPRCRDP